MNQIAHSLTAAQTWLLISLLIYFFMNGAGIFETAVLVPKWTKHPPQSLSVLQGPYAPNLKTFWIIIHSVHELTFIAAIIYCWQITAVRNSLLMLFGVHFIVRVCTLTYFAPRIMKFQLIDASKANEVIAHQVRQWRMLNYVRTGIFIVVSIGVVFVFLQLGETAHS